MDWRLHGRLTMLRMESSQRGRKVWPIVIARHSASVVATSGCSELPGEPAGGRNIGVARARTNE